MQKKTILLKDMENLHIFDTCCHALKNCGAVILSKNIPEGSISATYFGKNQRKEEIEIYIRKGALLHKSREGFIS